jgi:hypothetical protein
MSEIGSVGFAQGANEGVPMLSADLAVLVAVPLKGHALLQTSVVCFENLAEPE